MDLDKSEKSSIYVDGQELDNVTEYEYLGVRIRNDGLISPEIRRRLTMALTNIKRFEKLWKSVHVELKLKVIRTCIFPTAIYGCEAWTINKMEEKMINAFEMKCYRKILRIPWTAKETNSSVLQRIGVRPCNLLNKIKKQKLQYFGHIKRHDCMEKLFLEGMVNGKRGKGRPRKRWQQNITEWLGEDTTTAGRRAEERTVFRTTVWKATSHRDMPA